MDKPAWLIEDVFEDDTATLVAALQQTNTPYKIFDNNILNYSKYFKEYYRDEDCVVTYSSIQLATQIHRYTKWIPGSYYTVSNYYCSQYYQHFKPGHLLNSDCIFLPVWSIPLDRELLFSIFGSNGKLFIRPDSGSKPFTGDIVCADTFDQDFRHLMFYDPPKNSMCLISRTKNILEEYRLFVVDNKILGGSRYKPSTVRISRTDYNDVFSFGESTLSGWEPDGAWCLDICRTDDGNLYVLEINAFSTSGLYSTDMTPIVEAINTIAIKEYGEYQ